MAENAMDEVIPGLWIGDISAAKAQGALEQNNIKFVLSAMRGRVKVNPVRSNAILSACTHIDPKALAAPKASNTSR